MTIDFTKLLGFDTLDSVGLDFSDETFGAKLGAKVGDLERDPDNKLQFSRLLGFDTVSQELTAGVDLKDETLASKLGAKVGTGESMGPSEAEVLAAQISSETTN